MAWVVYVNHPNNKAIVHSDSCHRYRNRRREKHIMVIGKANLVISMRLGHLHIQPKRRRQIVVLSVLKERHYELQSIFPMGKK